jgi:hypothetical protein
VNKSTDEIKNNTPKTTNKYKIKYSKQAERLRFNELRDMIKQIIETTKQNNFIEEEPKSKTSKFSYNNRPERPKLTHTKNDVINRIKTDKLVNSLTKQ